MTHQARLREAARSIRRVATFTRTLEGPEAYAERLRLAEAQEAGAAALDAQAQPAEDRKAPRDLTLQDIQHRLYVGTAVAMAVQDVLRREPAQDVRELIAAAESFAEGATDPAGWIVRKLVAALYASQPAEDRATPRAGLLDVLTAADGALAEAEAVLGGEYGDFYGVLIEKILGFRRKLAALRPSAEAPPAATEQRLREALEAATDYIEVLEHAQDGYYRADTSYEAKAWEQARAALSAPKGED